MTDYSREEILANRKNWVEHLRSGKFKQTKGKLAKREPHEAAPAYCCLGVACEVLDVPSIELEHAFVFGVEGLGEASEGELPRSVQPALGFKHGDPMLVMPDPQDGQIREINLSVLNDTYDFTFEQIADAIELYRFSERSVLPGFQ